MDAAGKTVVILVNDPGFATQDEALFRGNAMTYYGRWTYKFEEAARQGAAGAIIVHEEAPAGYPWEVVSGSWTGPQFDQAGEDGNMGRDPHRGLGARRGGARDLRGGRTRLRRARAGGVSSRLPRRAFGDLGRPWRSPTTSSAPSRRTFWRCCVGGSEPTSTSSTWRTGIIWDAAPTPWRIPSSTAPSTTPRAPPG